MRRLVPVICFLLAACHSRGQLVLGLATDLSAKGQLDEVHLTVTRRGDSTPIVTRDWVLSGIPAADFRLPGSFNLYADDGQQPTFDVVIDGRLGGVSKVQRHAALGIVKGSDRFVRLTLVASCEQTGCPGSLECIEGKCSPIAIDPHRLPRYVGAMVNSLQCSSGPSFIDTSTKLAMPLGGSCEADEVCNEGTCLLVHAPGADPVPFTGAPADVFGLGASSAEPFVPVGALDTSRFFATATQLGDGRVLVVGGLPTFAADGTGTPVAGAVIYDASYAAFRRIVDPPAALAGHTATLLQDGSVLVVGTASGMPVAFTFDPTTETFTSRAAPHVAREFHTATLLASGQVLFVGGLSGTTVQPSAERWDPATQTFIAVASTPIDSRYFHAATVLANGDVLLTGGLVPSQVGPVPSGSTERYVAASDSFVASADMNVPRAMHTATALSDGTVLAVGGFFELPGDAHGDAELLLASTAQTLGSSPPFPAGLQQAIPLGGDRILFVGGAKKLDPDPSATPADGAYLFEDGAFVALPAPATPRIAGFAAAIPVGGDRAPDVLIGGGVPTMVPSDGGTDDFSNGDMATLCNPVTSTGCPDDKTQKCTVAGASTFGPGLFTDGARCVAAPTSPIALGGLCTATDADSSVDDGCSGGTVCMTDPVDERGHCQKLCATDVDCPDAVRNRCALVVATSQDTTAYGVCQIGCPYPDANQLCPRQQDDMGVHSLSCHFVTSIDKPGDAFSTEGICRFDGDLYYGATQNGSSCTQIDEADACAADYQCVGGRCLLMCVSKGTTSSNCATTCTTLIPQDPGGDGTCEPAGG